MLAALIDECGSLAAGAVPQLDESERARRVEPLELAEVDLDGLAARLYRAKSIESAANCPQRRERPPPDTTMRTTPPSSAALQAG